MLTMLPFYVYWAALPSHYSLTLHLALNVTHSLTNTNTHSLTHTHAHTKTHAIIHKGDSHT